MDSTHDIEIGCRCGTLKGRIRGVTPADSTHLMCLCDDCQAYAAFLGREGLVDQNGGTELAQVAHNSVELLQGQTQLACVRLIPQGMHRWYAACCHTPIANTLGPQGIFAGVHVACMRSTSSGAPLETALGPIRERVLGKFGKGELVPGTQQTISLGMMFFSGKRMLRWWLARASEPSAFFVAGRAVVEPRVLSEDERRALA